MDPQANCEYLFSLAEERFDFDVSLSPASVKGEEEEEDDEVFMGPIKDKERCVSVGVDTLVKAAVSIGPSVGDERDWSPQSGDKFEEICNEARQLARNFQCRQPQQQQEPNGLPAGNQEESIEHFEQNTQAKLNAFSKPTPAALSPIKRATFCVQDSPLKELPPAVQKRLLRGSSTANSGLAAKPRLSTSSPVRGAKTHSKVTLRSRAGLTGSAGVLPSKPAAPVRTTTTLNAAKTRGVPAEKLTRMPPPSKSTLGVRHSPTRRRSSRAGSYEDLLSDTASMASDVSDSSLNSSMQGKGRLVPPSKVRLSAKAPPPQTRKVPDKRRNTSSSSSSVSSLNSSLSVSPVGKAVAKAPLISSRSGQASSASRRANPAPAVAQSRRSSVHGRAAEVPPSTAGTRRSISAQGRKLSEAARPTPLSRPEPEPSGAPNTRYRTPSKSAMERTASMPNMPGSTRPQSVVKAIPKSKPSLALTPTGRLRGLQRANAVSSPDAPQVMKRIMSTCSVDSVPQRPAIVVPELIVTPSAGGSGQSRMRRPSALPTPANRRVSGIPVMTPRSLARPSDMPTPASRLPQWSPTHLKGSPSYEEQVAEAAAPEEDQVCPAEAQLQPFSLEDEPDQQPPSAASPSETQGVGPTPDGLSQESNAEAQECPESKGNQENQEPSPRGDSMELPSAEDLIDPPQTSGSKTQEPVEVLLVDAPVPVLRPVEKLLIDLSNTPELVRTAPGKPSAGQLIDLSSPLIKWSPEDRKKNTANEAPLINFSF
ncbi:G2 and S phase-expressed protein 1 [Aplochiton taeniatus]